MRTILLKIHSPEPPLEPLTERNEIWERYNELGKLTGNAWRKEKLYQELKLAGVEQRFRKTVCKSGYNFYGMHSALRDILIANGIMTWEEWRNGRVMMNLEGWQGYLSDFTMTVAPINTLASMPTKPVTPPVAIDIAVTGTNKAHTEYKQYKANRKRAAVL